MANSEPAERGREDTKRGSGERTCFWRWRGGAHLPHWSTARAEDLESTGPHRGEADNLPSQVFKWGTPRVATSSGCGQDLTEAKSRLEDQTVNWPTAQERDHKGIDQKAQNGEEGNQLPNAVEKWATPNTGGDKRGSVMPEKSRNRPEGSPRELTYDVGSFPCSLLAGDGATDNPSIPITPTSGLGLLLQRWTPPSCRGLNPKFQHFLMGFPVPICFESAEMASYRWRRQLRSLICFALNLEN